MPREHRIPVRTEDSATAIRRLETYVERMERRYEVSSETMERDVRAGRVRETTEVGNWLAKYHLLTRLREARAVGHEAG